MITTIQNAIENNLTVYIRLSNGDTISGNVEVSDDPSRIKIRNFEEVMWIPFEEIERVMVKA
ncbi:hypothetical protein [Paenibacillus thiaminolyticus]|uniref:Uncharacterized protein n=1 Tax=Paenibacillus thiaminolyticus TaxID=49283 RepID=A0A3A3H4U6_PANTH|nr:hypothetical protein [Paenibacillus thiaminolyticus]RJG26723.1 hypothetical protein DQX05_01435 [Paenibacillus thiaminolyticus]